MTAAEAGVVGAGRVGLSLAAALEASGEFDAVWVAGRRPGRPDFLRDRDGLEYGVLDRWVRELPGRPAEELLLFFCVPDASIREAARSWGRGLADAGILPAARSDAPGPELRAAFHTSGSRPASELDPLGAAAGGEGPPAASLHPLCALARPDPEAFRGVTFGVEGEEEAADLAAGIAAAIGRRALRVAPGEKTRYHAGAVLASNLLVACLGAGLGQLREATGGAASVDDLLPLARSALEQVERHGPAGGLTGPAVRGDAETLGAHLEALDPVARDLYAGLTEELLRQADPEPSLRDVFDDVLAGAPRPGAGGGAGAGSGRTDDPPARGGGAPAGD